jgi:hypothetical protein
MRTFNDQFCTEPFPFTGLQTEKRASGLVQPVNLEGLCPLIVLMDGPDGSGVKTGDVVLVLSSDCKAPYGRKRIKLLDGRVSIFVPRGAVYAVCPTVPVKPASTPMPGEGR